MERTLERCVAELAARYEGYTRNRIIDEKTGEEVIISVSENRKVQEELQHEIDELCALYLKVADKERDLIRNLVRPHRPLHNGLLRHIEWTARHKPSDWVRRGLAAASIEDNREDFRDTFVALGKLYLEAAEKGLDVSHSFQQVALLSNGMPGPLCRDSMSDFLAHFERSRFFEQSIRPRLPREKL